LNWRQSPNDGSFFDAGDFAFWASFDPLLPLSILDAKLINKFASQKHKTTVDSWRATLQIDDEDVPNNLLTSVDDNGLTLVLGFASADDPIDTVTFSASQCKTVGKKVTCKQQGNKLSVTLSAAVGKKSDGNVIVKVKATSRELDMSSSTRGPIAIKLSVPKTSLYFGGETDCKSTQGFSQHKSLICGDKY
jgi:hypothetical protein